MTWASGDRILITGSRGLVGRALTHHLRASDAVLLTPTRQELDLNDRAATRAYFATHRPRYVFHLAAKVGGIRANIADPVGFLNDNALMNLHVLEAAHATRVEKTLVLGSSCIYPRACPQPMREEHLLTGPLEPTNEGYALAKILALKQAEYYHTQYGLNVVCPIPSNIYGPGDSFDLERSHVLSALVRRFCEARDANAPAVKLWGRGQARREFLHVSDVVRGLIFCFAHLNSPTPHNLGAGEDISVAELAALIARQTGYRGRIEWDTSQPEGMPRKLMDVSRLRALGFRAEMSLEHGVATVIADFESRSRSHG